MARPKSGDNPLKEYAEDDSCSTPSAGALRVLLREAVRRGLTPTSLANAVNCDRKSLADYVNARKPSRKVIERIAKALGYPPIVARALLGELDDRDVRGIRGISAYPATNHTETRETGWSINVALLERRDVIDDFDEQYESFDRAWPLLSPDRRRAAAAAFVLACEGLATEGRGPLAALQHELAKDGHVLAIAECVERREAAIAFSWLAEAASLSAADQEKLWSMLRVRLGAEHPSAIEVRADHFVTFLRDTLRGEIGAKP